MPIELLDIILIFLMLVSGLLAMVRGFSREVLSIGSWIVALFLAFIFHKSLAPFVAGYTASITSNEVLPLIVAGAIIFVIALIVVSLITIKIADLIVDSRVGALDRTLGFIFGAARGFLLVTVLTMFAEFLISEQVPTWVTEAKSKPMIDSVGQSIINSIPDDPSTFVFEKLGIGSDPSPEGQDT